MNGRTTPAVLAMLLGLGLLSSSRGSTAEPSVVPPHVMQAASARGSVRVIVHLNDAGLAPEAALAGPAAIAGQRQTIGLMQRSLRQGLRGTSHRVLRQYETLPFVALHVTPDALRMLQSMRGLVTGVQEDRPHGIALAQSAPLVQAPQVWAAGMDGRGTVIAILDTGVDGGHPFLAGKVVAEACYASHDGVADGVGDCPDGADTQVGPGAAAPCPFAECFHGTHVAGIAAGNGEAAVPPAPFSGIARGADVIAVQVFSNDPSWGTTAFDSDLIAGLEHVYALRNTYNIAAVNMSLGGEAFTSQAQCDLANGATKAAIDQLRTAGIATVIASGNENKTNAIDAPGCISTAVSVGSTGDGTPDLFPLAPADQVSFFSNAASFLSLFAPGMWITSSFPSSDPDGPYQTIAGTSMATPHVAGAFAVLKQAMAGYDPATWVTAALAALRATGTAVTDARAGAPVPHVTVPRINVFAAVESLGPDLSVPAVTSPAGAAVGTNVSVTYTVRNGGGQAANNFAVGFALAPLSDTSGASDVAIGPTIPVPVLAPGTSRTVSSVLFIPPSVASGAYRLRVIADVGNTVAETNEANNTRLAGNTFTVGRADLTVASVTFAPAAIAAGGAGANVSITHVVRNRAAGPGTAPASLSHLYLSSTNASASAVADLGVVGVPALAAGSAAGVTKTVLVPGSVPPGRYLVLAQADAPEALAEGDEGNNVGVSAARLVVGPDLTVTAATAPAGAAPGTSLNVSYTLRNAGGQAASGFAVGFALVPAADPSGLSDIAIRSSRTMSLAARTSASFVAAVRIPPDTAAGSYHIRVIADVGDVVTEADETNNMRLTAAVNVALPDLTVPSVAFAPPISRANGSISITHAVRNLSAVPGSAPASFTRLWLSLDGNTAGAIDLGTVSVPSLIGGATATVTSVLRIPVGTPTGVYYVLAGADDPNAIAEVREDNNLARGTTRLIVGPDVKAVAVTTVAAAARGMNVSAPVTLRNQGGAPAGPFTLSFALAPVSDPSGASDLAVGPGRSVGPLAAGASISVPGVIRVPPDAPAGVYRMRVSALGVADANPRNDSLLSTGTLTVVLPDLVVSSVSAPAVAIAGRTIMVASAVTNNAALAPAGAFHVGLYLADALLAERAMAGLGPMATSSTPFSVALPGTPGTFQLKVVADDQGEAAESSETDNARIASTAIAIVPDMVRSTGATFDAQYTACTNPAALGTASLTGALDIRSQTGRSWAATLTLADPVSGDTAVVTTSGATVNADGTIAGAFSFRTSVGATLIATGGGSFAGTATSNGGDGGALSATVKPGATVTFTAAGGGGHCTLAGSFIAP